MIARRATIARTKPARRYPLMETTGRSLCAAAGSIVCRLRQPTYIICHRSPPHEYGTIRRSRWPPRTAGRAQPANRHPQAHCALATQWLNAPRNQRSLPHARFRTAYQTLRLRNPTIANQSEQSQDNCAESREAFQSDQCVKPVPIGTAPTHGSQRERCIFRSLCRKVVDSDGVPATLAFRYTGLAG